METRTRTIIQIKYYFLQLRRVGINLGNVDIVCYSTEREKIINYYTSMLCNKYQDDYYWKNFKKGSDLEWYNPTNLDIVTKSGCGIDYLWVNEGELNTRITILQ